MIALNEAHNLEAVLDNLDGWAEEVFLVDSCSSDGSVDIALRRGVHVVQRRFTGFGEQWNFALSELPIRAPWTMKLDPDERLPDRLKRSIAEAIERGQGDALSFDRRLWFMASPLPVRQRVLRVWRTGHCRFTDVVVNEHPLVEGRVEHIDGELEHHDSPDLEHWIDKQNRYTSAEAAAALRGDALAALPRLFGTPLQRRMWMKKHYRNLPFRYAAMFFYHYVVLGAWRAGRVGHAWSHLRCEVYRLVEYKLREMRSTGCAPVRRHAGPGAPDPRVRQY
ncbi:MAG TPA: glycosyltransferase family 2 protein [Dokdonella sp.]|nr:glycosyltransferase family 2 protein [Dokdonella sp.]